VERLLVLAMPEEESLPGIEPIPLVDLVEEVIAALPAPSRARVEFVPDAPDLGVVRGDAALLELAIANLLDNALKYSSKQVRVRVSATRDVLALEVEDEGPGIPEHERDKLFQPFHRGAATRHVRGHGIGLAIVAKVVAAHKGTVSLGGDQGLRVRMELPPIAL
jgi:signal transduction histidine kinase